MNEDKNTWGDGTGITNNTQSRRGQRSKMNKVRDMCEKGIRLTNIIRSEKGT